MDPGIICFKHCNALIFTLPPLSQCPKCKTELEKLHFSQPPFRIPYPFVKAHQYPRSVLIKPTFGDFLNEYLNTTPLHIGVTTSDGTIVEFDEEGLKRHQCNTKWYQCLLLEQVPVSWSEHWDQILHNICNDPCWTRDIYNENDFNCYTFVLRFLRNLNYGNLTSAAQESAVFCEHIIAPKTTVAAKYISLYRKLLKSGFVIENL